MKKTVKVEGMMCDGCVSSVHDILSNIDGVTSVHVNLKEGTAEIESETDISVDQLQNAIEENDGNYEVSSI